MRPGYGAAFAAATIALGLTAAGTAFATRTIRANPPNHIGVTHLGDWNVGRDPGYPAAVSHLGSPTDVAHPDSPGCKAKWARLGLSIQFESFGGGANCSDGFAQKAKILGNHARESWRTNRGLRVGDSAAKLRQLYPNARKHGTTWWVVYLRHSPFGTGGPLPIIKAHMHNHHVAKFGLWIGGAGE